MRVKLIYLLLLSMIFPLMLNAEKMQIAIKYLGFKVVAVEIVDKNNELSIYAVSSPIASIASSMDNNYSIKYYSDFMPRIYSKKIRQKNYLENRYTEYFHDLNIAKRFSFLDDEKISEYEITATSRDFFTALYYLRSQIFHKEKGFLWLDANKIIWKTEWEIVKKEEIKTIFGSVNTLKVKLTFSNYYNLPKERTDMLTNNLVNEKKSLYFWFTDDEKKIPVKAIFSSKPFSVGWVIESYEE